MPARTVPIQTRGVKKKQKKKQPWLENRQFGKFVKFGIFGIFGVKFGAIFQIIGEIQSICFAYLEKIGNRAVFLTNLVQIWCP